MVDERRRVCQAATQELTIEIDDGWTVLESLIRHSLTAFLEEKSFISKKHHAFIRGRSCLTNLLGILRELDTSLGYTHMVLKSCAEAVADPLSRKY